MATLTIQNFEKYDSKTLPALFIMIEKELIKLKETPDTLFEPIQLNEKFTIEPDYGKDL